LPYTDSLQIRVLGIGSETPILGGTVYRSSLAESRQELSIGMRLRELGITYHSEGIRFESLADHGRIYDRPLMDRFPEMATFYRSRKP